MLARSLGLVGLLALGGGGVPGQPAASPPPASPASVQPVSPPAAAPLPPGARSPRNASYTIAARLDPSSRTLEGNEVITWRNTSSIPATSLRFHLYYNAWRNTRSTWMREQRLSGDLTHFERPERDWGWIDIKGIQLPGSGNSAGAGPDLSSRLRFISPDDGNPDDQTVAELPLERPVGPGETIAVTVSWTSRVPRTFARTGAIGDYYFLAQWFPKIGVLEDTGWNCHQFHYSTEFFADFGTYDVSLTVPAGWVVGATGLQRESGNPDAAVQIAAPPGTTTHRYYQEDVHDFAWTTSPDYIEHRARFEHATLPAVEMRLLLQPDHADQAERHFAATRATLKHYGEWFGPYPYGHITIVDPAWHSGADGMEYPTLFTAGSRWLAPKDATEPEGVTIHEAGHQYWYGIVASNEFEHAWMDEGLNTFSTARVIAQTYEPNYYVRRYFGGFVPWVFRDLPLSREIDGNRLGHYRKFAKADAQSIASWRYWPPTAGAITYDKTALWLHTLERMVGWETLQRILSTYFQRWAFKHPKPQDFFAIVNEVSGKDLTWFFDQVHRSADVFDYGIDTFSSEPATARGYVGRAFSESEGPRDRYRTTVVVRRFGEAEFPVDVRVVLENREEVRWHWDGRDRWKLFEIDKSARALSAQVDPDRVLLLDVNYTNNSATLNPQAKAAARKWSWAWLIWLQDHLLTYGFFV